MIVGLHDIDRLVAQPADHHRAKRGATRLCVASMRLDRAFLNGEARCATILNLRRRRCLTSVRCRSCSVSLLGDEGERKTQMSRRAAVTLDPFRGVCDTTFLPRTTPLLDGMIRLAFIPPARSVSTVQYDGSRGGCT